MNKGVAAIFFIFGASAGSLLTWRFAKNKYEKIADDEIAAFKAALSKRKPAISEKPDLIEFVKLAANYRGEQLEIVKEPVKNRAPYFISPEEFGENDDYHKVLLTFYADDVLTDDSGDEIDNGKELLGGDSMARLLDHNEDVVYVRNEERNVDYEITLDPRDYSDLE